MQNFDLVYSLPLIFFFICSVVVFVLFMWSATTLLLAKGDYQKIIKGKKILLRALIFLFIVVLAALVFYIVSYFVTREAFKPGPPQADLPISQAIGFPPSPQFIKVGDYYLDGPWQISKRNSIGTKSGVYVIMCKKSDGYDIIYINEKEITSRAVLFSRERTYNCWLGKCEGGIKNLSVAVFWTQKKYFDTSRRVEVKNELMRETAPACSDEVRT